MTSWNDTCARWKSQWPVMQDEYLDDSDGRLDLYAVMDGINRHSPSDAIFMGDAGSAYYLGPTMLEVHDSQRIIYSTGQGDMGWALPGAIGVALSCERPVISIIGDGSFMSNIQELAVVTQHQLKIKFVILNNNGYLSIKNTQKKYFENRVYGSSGTSGLWFPNFKDIAHSFQLDYAELSCVRDLENLSSLLATERSMIINCLCKETQEIKPSQAIKNGKQCGLHDLAPFLTDEELDREMIVKI